MRQRRYPLHVARKASGTEVLLEDRRVIASSTVLETEEDPTSHVVTTFLRRAAIPARSVRCELTLDGFARGLAIARTKPYWTAPHFVSDTRLLGPSNHLLVWQRSGGAASTYLAMIPLCGNSFVGRLGYEDYAFGITLETNAGGCAAERIPLFAVAAGDNPAELVRDIVRVGLASSGVRGRARTEKKFPAPLTRLGWCTWNALGKALTRNAIKRTIHELGARGVPIGFVLVDDGWQTVADGRLAAFEADPQRFPGGIGGLVTALSPLGIDVGVWHTLHGYWAGVDAGLAARLSRVPFVEAADGAVVPQARDAEPFFEAYYEHLAREGVRFVKVDNQAGTAQLFEGKVPLLDASQGLHAGLDTAAERAFGEANVIDCMAMTLDNAYSWGSSSVVRTSDDYVPDVPGNVQEHVHRNAFNALWAAAFAWPDWDMFQTHDEHAVTHAVGRVVSGGPIYLTDVASRTRPEVVAPLILGDSTVLRPDEPGQVFARLLLRDPSLEPIPLLVGAPILREGVRAALIAAFHVNKWSAEVEGEIRAEDLVALGLTLPAVVATPGTGPMATRVDRGQAVPIRLSSHGAQVFVASSIEGDVAAIGRIDKYAAPAAIVRCERTDESVRVVVAEPGDVAVWIERGGAGGSLVIESGADVTFAR
jgi:raffinose synthase